MCKLFLDLKIIIQLIFVGLGFGLKFQNLSQKQDFLFSSLFPKFLGISVAPAFNAIVVPLSDGGRGCSIIVYLCLRVRCLLEVLVTLEPWN
jgi:hypothetical protein